MSTVYLDTIKPLLGRTLSMLDWEPTSPSHGSFDRTWWCWKFTDFSASRFQEGAYLLAWLLTSPHTPIPVHGRERLRDGAAAAIRFWRSLQHADGSFDEAYPFERSLAATAFTGFYVGCAVERLGDLLNVDEREHALAALERGARWLAANGEYHGILSNHLAAAAAALQLVGDLTGTDRFQAARDRYLETILREQQPREGWLREYGGADPGYQSHAMFYLAEIQRRTGDDILLDSLSRASDFLAWFAHPDGTLGGEHTSRGTKFFYPAGLEMLAERIPSAAAIAAHARASLSKGRGVGAAEMDAWNQFPLVNNLLFAADAATPLADAPPLPWQTPGARKTFPEAGLAVARRGDRVLVVGAKAGGVVKLWQSDGDLLYEDCGYVVENAGGWAASQGASTCLFRDASATLTVEVKSDFARLTAERLSPPRFIAFRLFTTTIGRLPALARWLKSLMVRKLVSTRAKANGILHRYIFFEEDGTLVVEDNVEGVASMPQPVGRLVPFHMGSSRYADATDAWGAKLACPSLEGVGKGHFHRRFVVSTSGLSRQ
ncbi:MAG: hypothetical protein ABJG86_01270 [Nitratireductor sp.]|uniref:hypothetical protein n=1 Tax=Alphaproteobacteria TaxID=28211 RepID=UPI003291B324